MSDTDSLIKELPTMHAQYLEALAAKDAAEQAKEEALEAWRAENSDLYEAARDASERVTILRTQIETQARFIYAETRNKQVGVGISLREHTQFDVDVDEATAWARTNAPALLTIDSDLYEKAFGSGAFHGIPGAYETRLIVVIAKKATA